MEEESDEEDDSDLFEDPNEPEPDEPAAQEEIPEYRKPVKPVNGDQDGSSFSS